MDSKSYRTQYLNKDSIQKNWFVADADGKTLGRFSSEIAKVLRGKNKASFTPHLDCGDYVIVINSDNIKLTGNKWKDKKYVTHTGYPGGIKETTPEKLSEKKPGHILKLAVKRMLPGGVLGKKQLTKLKIYSGDQHPHSAQNPKIIDLNKLNNKNIVRN